MSSTFSLPVSLISSKIGFEQRNTVGEKFGQWAVQIVAERGVQRILEDVRELACDFGEARKAVAGRCAAQSVGGDVEALEIFAARLRFPAAR